MTKFIHILSMAALATCMTACDWDDPFLYNREDIPVTTNPGSSIVSTTMRSITVYSECDAKSISSPETMNVLWQKGDEICVYSMGSEDEEMDMPMNYLQLTEGNGTSEGLFTCESKMEFTKNKGIYVLYPSTMRKEGEAPPLWPGEQVYYPDNPEHIHVPMFADARMSSDRSHVTDVNMNILGGMLKLKVTCNCPEVGLTRIVFSTDKPMAGHIRMNNNSGYYKAIIYNDADMANNCILHCASRVTMSQGDQMTFCVNLPENSYNGMTVTLYDRDEDIARERYEGKVYIDRAKVTQRELTISEKE